DGAPALVVAVDRRAVARRNATPRGSSPFLLAVAQEIAARRGASDPATRAAFEISVDSTAFYDQATARELATSARLASAVAAPAAISTGPRSTPRSPRSPRRRAPPASRSPRHRTSRRSR